jgi:DNA-nicking Smr family endonuclease
MTRRREISAEDRALFRAHVGAVRQVRADRADSPPRRPPPVPRQRLADEEKVIDDLSTLDFDPGDIETGEELLFRGPGLRDRQFRRLRRGQYRVDGHLDLHGFTAEAARAAVAAFLTVSRREGKRCVRIVHGKGRGSRNGRPVLKTRIHHWLRQRADVLGFCSALPPDGGTGAVYVLLRKAG